jgi:hypothetical protein
MRRETTRRAKYRGGDHSTRRRSTRRAGLLGISHDEEFPNKESMVEADEI